MTTDLWGRLLAAGTMLLGIVVAVGGLWLMLRPRVAVAAGGLVLFVAGVLASWIGSLGVADVGPSEGGERA